MNNAKPPTKDKHLDEAFEDDLLDRKEFIEKLNHKLYKISEAGGTIAIHAEWGLGKTWICNRWIKYLQEASKTEYSIIKIDAFTCDYVSEPFDILHRHFENILKKGKEKETLLTKAMAVSKASLPLAMKCLLPYLPELPGIGKILHVVLSKIINDNEKENLEDIVEAYRSSLENIIHKQQKRIIVFVDELDRCNPKFAVHFLEKMKHYFDIKGIVFVLIINKEQLSKSINGFYGQDVDGIAYLEKFLSLPVIDLPSHHLQSQHEHSRVEDRASFKIYKRLIKEKFQSLESGKKFDSIYPYLLRDLSIFSEIYKLNYREHEQALLWASFCEADVDVLLSYLLILKLRKPSLLKDIYEGKKDAHQDAQKLLAENKNDIEKCFTEPNKCELYAVINSLINIHVVLSTDNKEKQSSALEVIRSANAEGLKNIRDAYDMGERLKNAIFPLIF